MEGASILELLAELAVGVLGFSGIVTVLGPRGATGLTSVDRTRLFSMAFMGALVVVLSLLPFALYHAGLRDQALWGWASAVGAGAYVLCNALTNRIVGGSIAERWRDPSVSNLVLGIGIGATNGGTVLLALNAVGLLPRTFAPYLIAVLLMFAVALMSFVRLLQSVAGGGSGQAA